MVARRRSGRPEGRRKEIRHPRCDDASPGPTTAMLYSLRRAEVDRLTAFEYMAKPLAPTSWCAYRTRKDPRPAC